MRRGFLLNASDKPKRDTQPKNGEKSTKRSELPPELMIRVVKILGDDKRSISTLSKVSRDWYVAAIPHMLTEVGHEFHHIAKMFDLCKYVEEE